MTETATVEVLSAEVRVLMVGSRQVTLSVYRQLDAVPCTEITPLGRVNDKQDNDDYGVFVVGKHTTGALVRSSMKHPYSKPSRRWEVVTRRTDDRDLWNGRRHPYDSKKNERRVAVAPFREERRKADRRVEKRRKKQGSGVRVWSETVEEYNEAVRVWKEYHDDYLEWCALPLIVLAGLR